MEKIKIIKKKKKEEEEELKARFHPLSSFLRARSLFFLLFRAVPTAYGVSRARGQIRATAASHSHSRSHSNAGSQPRLQPTPQLTAMPDP